MTDAGDAFVRKGARGNWPPTNNPPSYSIGFTLGHGSWPEWEARNATMKVRMWRNPNPSPDGSYIWDEPARYGSIAEWKPKKAKGWFIHPFFRDLKQWQLDIDAVRTPLPLPWGKNWCGPGGTQSTSSDNGMIVNIDAERSYEILGLAPLSVTDVAQINARALAPVASLGDFRCDGIAARAPGIRPHGSQGPLWKRDGLLRPDDLSRPWTEPKRLVAFNVDWGPKATAAKGGWVEHPEDRPPYEGVPESGHADLIPCFTLFRLDITDADIEAWIESEGVHDRNLAESMRWFARGSRSQGWRLAESGTGVPFIESTGGVVPSERSAWAARGITDEATANRLGRNLLRFGTLREVVQ